MKNARHFIPSLVPMVAAAATSVLVWFLVKRLGKKLTGEAPATELEGWEDEGGSVAKTDSVA